MPREIDEEVKEIIEKGEDMLIKRITAIELDLLNIKIDRCHRLSLLNLFLIVGLGIYVINHK